MGDRQYQVGGSLAKDAPTYVSRQADRQLYQALQQGEVCYLFDSRQMGKSSLLIRTLDRLSKEGSLTVAIDLTYLGSEFTNPLQWYKGLVAQLWTGLGLDDRVNLKSWWQEREDFSYLQRLAEFIDLVLKCFPQQKIFVFIDELDRIGSLDFPVDDFLALIRYCYNRRAIDSAYGRITFGLFGVAAPGDLIKNKKLTPFNIGKAIALEGFKLEETAPLIAGLSAKFNNSRAVMQQILAWTNGQPFLTQKLCQLIVETDIEPNLSPSSLVEGIVHRDIINNWQAQDEPDHLKTIRDRLLYNPRNASRLLGIYHQILQSKLVSTNNSPEQLELLLSGLVIKKNNYLQVKNKIYKTVFNDRWVEQQLNNLRPYRISFDAWLKDGKDNHLLTGLPLKEALAWADNKQLSDLDYRFLNASQQLTQQSTERDLAQVSTEKEKAQFALHAVKEANRAIALARHHAQEKIKQLRISKTWIGIVAIAVFFLTISLRLTGVLQGLELTALDLYFQQRPVIESQRLTIITIDESDIQKLGQFPVSDRILARSLTSLIRYQPRIIGLNLYRDLAIPPGSQELQQLLESTPNIIGIEKVVGTKILPPPSLKRNQIGFADQIFDRDGTIRRALLSVRNNNTVDRSFSLRLALKYLQQEGIQPQPLGNLPSHIKLGKTILIPFQPNDGSYIRADAGGYQIPINYRGTLEHFTHYSLTDLLAGNVPSEAIRDRIVLIGSIADTTSDLSPTPFSTWQSGKQMAWVTIHANIISQLLSAAIDGRAMLCTVSEGMEWLYVLFGAVVGSCLSWRLRVLWRKAIALIFVLAAIAFLTYLTFLQGWWLPMIPIAIAFIFAVTLIALITQRQLATMQLRETVKQLTIISQEQPTVKQVAFELLKQGESKSDRELIDKTIQH